MPKRLQYRRLLWLGLLLILAFAGLGYRLVEIQVLRHDKLSAEALNAAQLKLIIEPRRGDILDAKGNPLATSVSVRTVRADARLIGDRQAEVAHALAPLLQQSETRIQQALLPRIRPGAGPWTNRYILLAQRVPVETWQQIQSAMTNLSFGLNEKKLGRAELEFYQNLRQKGVYAEEEQLRVYPNQNLAAQVLGFVGDDRSESGEERGSGMRGREGIERTFDERLRGLPGWRLTKTDRRGRELVSQRQQDVAARDGLNVVLTLDTVIQHIVESTLAEATDRYSPISICGIVMRPRTGEILAMATLPSFDPNRPGDSTDALRRNRVMTDAVEPGSTFKIVVVSAALNEGLVALSDSFDCEHAHFYFAGKTLHDHESHGVLSVAEIISKSSNIGAAKIGIKLGQNRLYDYICDFGFGKRSAIPLPAETPGILHPLKDWTKVSIAQIPMGQGIAVTPLQMTLAMCAIANHGLLMRPMLVQRLENRDHAVEVQYVPQPVRQVMTPATATLMTKALKGVVTAQGTGPKAALEHYTVAGKTGTAQKLENGHYVSDKSYSSFIGFFPADNPELCIAVMLDEPKRGNWGGQTAAPVFKQIAERAANYLNIRPEDTPDPSLPESFTAPAGPRPIKTAAARSP